MIDASEKLPNDHAHDTQGFGLENQLSEFFEHGLEPGAVGEFEGLADMLVKRFAHGSACQAVIASATALLQSADEVEVAELHDPALARTELEDSGNLVGDRGPDASVKGKRNGGEGLSPALQVLPPWPEQGIEEDGSILTDGFDRHHIQNPIFPAKAEIKPIQDQNQGASRQAQDPRLEHKSPQGSAPAMPHRLWGKASAGSQTLQRSSLNQNSFQQTGSAPPRLATSFLCPDTPCPLAMAALPTARSEAVDSRSATDRFRVQRIHARELDTN